MPEKYEFEKRYWYPHMMPADVALWERFIDQHPFAYNSVEYDVKVGTIPDFVKDHPEEQIRSEAPLYARKIDVVGHSGENIDIVEVKPRGGMSAIGQLKGYIALYKRDVKPEKEPRGVLITDRADADTKEIALLEGIRIIEV